MTNLTRRALSGLVCATAMTGALTTFAAAQDQGVSGPVILTVTGNLSAANRAGFDELNDKFFGFNEVNFDAAAQFDYDKLKGLETVSVKADFPKGGDVYTFEGPLLADVLKAAGADGKMVTVQAIDGYAVEVAMQDLVDKGAVVALSRDGVPFAIGDYGPTQIVFPRAERSELADMPDDNWVWSVFHISVQ